jgi:hypothetical protein
MVNLLANQHCAEDIDKAIAKNGNIMGYDKTTQGKLFNRAFETIAEVYGNERVATVLGINIEAREQTPNQERFSPEIKEWGEQFKVAGVSVTENPMLLESNYRPPLMLTNTEILTEFVKIAMKHEITVEKEPPKQQKSGLEATDGEFETITVDLPKETAKTLIAVNEMGNQDVGMVEIPQTEDIVKILAVKEIVASMSTPDMMKMVEQQLMNYDLEALQAVYPHVFEDAEPDRSVIAEKIVSEIQDRSPITTEEYPEVFNEVFNQKIVEPITGNDYTVYEQDTGDYIAPENPANQYEGQLNVTVGNVLVEGVNEQYVNDLKSVLMYNGARNFTIDTDTAGEVKFDVRSDSLMGTTREEADKLAVGYAQAVTKSWNNSIDVAHVNIDEIARPAPEIPEPPEPPPPPRGFDEIVTALNEELGTDIDVTGVKNIVLSESYKKDDWTIKENVDLFLNEIPLRNYAAVTVLLDEMDNWLKNVESITVTNQAELESISKDTDMRVIIEGGTQEQPIEVANRLVFVENDNDNNITSHVKAVDSFVVMGVSASVIAQDSLVRAHRSLRRSSGVR